MFECAENINIAFLSVVQYNLHPEHDSTRSRPILGAGADGAGNQRGDSIESVSNVRVEGGMPLYCRLTCQIISPRSWLN